MSSVGSSLVTTRVLVVDDEGVSRTLLSQSLQRHGFDVLEACGAEHAMELIRQNECQLVITDWEMPGMSGLDLCKSLRAGAVDWYVYIVIVTQHDDIRDVINGLEAGADDFVTKPFDPLELAIRLRAGQRILTVGSTEMTIFALAKLAESRDPETGAHLERVQHYCRALTAALRLEPSLAAHIDAEFEHLVYHTSPLHDIGKVAIPDRVLLKAGRLSPDEFEIMKTHTLRGAETLEAAIRKYPNAPFLRMARDIALTHHERYDGSGYPHGLRGDNIPLAGRIMAVADVYDALTSKRVYKEAHSHAACRDALVQGSGTHFDQRVVRAFLTQEQQFVRIREAFDDSRRRTAA